jgi:hypothetical protein
MKAKCRIPLVLLSLCSIASALAEPSAARIEFNRDVLPILSDKCFKCHGPDAASREADLRLDRRDDTLAEHDSGLPIVPDKADASKVVRRIESADRDKQMPPPRANMPLSKKEIATLRRWIAEGAEYQAHWSIVPPKAAPLPAVKNTAWPRNELDRWVLARLESEGLAPSPEADAATLLRRVALALTGLPHRTHASHESYEQAVDRQLASPRFGERMALDWLDAARYADTNGYYNDNERQAWPWRDWVIAAFNRNLPFDRFTIEQLAGDLLPGATTEQRIATGFNRNHMVTNETGIIEEEYRLGYVADRVDTTTAVWLGLTMGCARCHDHKYDPITQREYYEVFAAFNNIDETGIVKDVAPLSPAPTLLLPSAEQERRLADLEAQRKEREAALRKHKPALEKAMAEWEPKALDALAPLPTTGSVAHFPFEENAGTATVSGTMAYAVGAKGNAANFDATQYVESDAALALERDRPFTFAAWILPGNAPQGCVVSKMDSDSVARGFEILWYKSQPRINLAHRYGTDGIEVVGQQKFNGKVWQHLVVTYDGSAKATGLKVYVDGALNPVDVRRDKLTGSVASAEPWRIAWKGTGIGFEGGIDEVRLYDRALAVEEVAALHWREFLEGAFAVPPKERVRAQADKLETYYIAQHGSEELKQLSAQVAALRADEDAAKKTVISTSVMQEMKKPRTTHLLKRGQYDAPGEPVEFGVPAALGTLPADAPKNRLGFAQWLVSRDNPLTARVAVNRLWQQCFGEGLVRTTNDFGLQGEAPSHPELLD